MNFENYKLPEGSIIVAFSDNSLSIGTLKLKSGKVLQKHNRPATESLFQLKGNAK